jgi:hypothetical protein
MGFRTPSSPYYVYNWNLYISGKDNKNRSMATRQSNAGDDMSLWTCGFVCKQVICKPLEKRGWAHTYSHSQTYIFPSFDPPTISPGHACTICLVGWIFKQTLNDAPWQLGLLLRTCECMSFAVRKHENGIPVEAKACRRAISLPVRWLYIQMVPSLPPAITYILATMTTPRATLLERSTACISEPRWARVIGEYNSMPSRRFVNAYVLRSSLKTEDPLVHLLLDWWWRCGFYTDIRRLISTAFISCQGCNLKITLPAGQNT